MQASRAFRLKAHRKTVINASALGFTQFKGMFSIPFRRVWVIILDGTSFTENVCATPLAYFQHRFAQIPAILLPEPPTGPTLPGRWIRGGAFGVELRSPNERLDYLIQGLSSCVVEVFSDQTKLLSH